MERIASTLLYYKNIDIRDGSKFSALERWFNAMNERKAYVKLKGNDFTHAHALPLQVLLFFIFYGISRSVLFASDYKSFLHGLVKAVSVSFMICTWMACLFSEWTIILF